MAGLLDRLVLRLRRETSSGGWIPQIDGLRFVAITTVFLVHVIAYTRGKMGLEVLERGANAENWFTYDWNDLARGVQLFFVISGFIIALPFVKRFRQGAPRVSLKDYFLRRVSRLEPPFILAMTLAYASLVLGHGSPAGPLFPHWLATCTYLHGLIYGGKSTIAYITWSLEIEVQFYVLAPLICGLLGISNRAFRWAALGALGVGALALHAATVHSYPRIEATLPSYLHFFIAGILAADLLVEAGLEVRTRYLAWDLVGMFACVTGYLLNLRNPVASGLTAVCFGIFLLSAFHGRILRRFLSLPWVAVIGGMCYSIYLLHSTLIFGFGRLTTRYLIAGELGKNIALQTALLFLPVFGLSAVYFLAIEKPFMSRGWVRRVRLDRSRTLSNVRPG